MTDVSRPQFTRPDFNLSIAETDSAKLSRKTKESPFFVVGVTGCVLVALYGAYKFKNRGNVSASLYLMQLRVAAQGTVVAACTAGVMHQLYHKLVDPWFTKEKDQSH